MTERLSKAEAALADPGALRAWRRERARTLAALVLWTLGFVAYAVLGAIAVSDLGVSRAVVIVVAVPVVLVLVAGLLAANLRWEQLGVIGRVLEAYPWRELPAIGAAHPAGVEYFRLPDPEKDGKRVKVAFRRFGRGARWQRAVSDARAEASAYAGDPRFACVVFTPQALLAVRPQHAVTTHAAIRPDSVGEAAWERARAAGITAPPSEREKFRRLLSSVWRNSSPARARNRGSGA